MSDANSEFYKLDVECPNCHFSKKGFDIPKGSKLNEMTCSNCQLKTLVESIRTTSFYNFGNNGWDY